MIAVIKLKVARATMAAAVMAEITAHQAPMRMEEIMAAMETQINLLVSPAAIITMAKTIPATGMGMEETEA